MIDGRVGLVGGINVTDDENEQVRPQDAYRDTHLLLRGSAVRWLQYVFLQDWYYASGRQPAHDGHMLPRGEPPGQLPVQIVAELLTATFPPEPPDPPTPPKARPGHATWSTQRPVTSAPARVPAAMAASSFAVAPNR